MPKLTEQQKRHLRALGHKLKPVVMISGDGFSPPVREELELQLLHHELLKVRVSIGERTQRDTLIEEMCTAVGAVLIQRIGNIALLYRSNPDKPRLKLA